MVKLRKYQREGVRLMDKFRGRVLLADEMGLGKTVEVLYWLHKHPKIRPVLIICPAGLKYNWKREARKHLGMRTFVVDSSAHPRRSILGENQIVIINYEILYKWRKHIREFNPRCVVIDECHYISSRTTIRTRMVKEISRFARYRIGMSGTPQTNRPAELWPILNLLAPESYNSFFSFSQKFCKPTKKPWGWVHTGAKNLPLLHSQLKKRCMIRRLIKDVENELPPKIRSVVPMKIRRPEEYAEARDHFLKWLSKEKPERVESAARAKTMVQMGYLKRLAVRLKIRAVYAWVKDFLEQSDGKLILFGIHKKPIHILHEKFKSTSLVIDGSVTGLDRQKTVDTFQRDNNYRILIGNMKAAGVGITLTAASTVAFFEMGWTPGGHTQAEARPHRIGQKHTVMVYYLVAMGTIEEKLCQILQSKQVVQNAVLDGEDSEDDLSVYDMLIKEMGKHDAT